MSSQPSPADPAAVLAHSRWLERLAASLVADPGLAADLAQEVRIAALLSRPDAGRPLRGWLATVMRNLVRQLHRADARRARREEASAPREAQPPGDDVVARLELQRRVLAAAAALEEPYRSTILLRYFEDLGPRTIAERQGVPVATVKTRLQRGLALLRARLDRDAGGDGRSWALALVPLCRSLRPFASPFTSSLGTLLMSSKAALLVVLLGAAGAGLYVFLDRPMQGDTPRSRDAAARTQAPDAVPRAPVVADAEAVRRAAGTPDAATARAPAKTDAPEPVPATPAPAPRVRGQVLDASAQPVGGLALRFETGWGRTAAAASAGDAPLRSDPSGRFDFPAPADWSRLVAADPAVATVYAGVHGLGGDGDRAELAVIVAPAVTLGGHVAGEDGAPFAGAQVAFHLPSGFRARFRIVLDAAADAATTIETAADGAFTFAQLPRIDGATIVAMASGFTPAFVAVPSSSTSDLRLVLARVQAAESRVEGVVVDPTGAPVEGAFVSLRGEITSTDPMGRFALDLDDAVWATRMAERFRDTQARALEMIAGSGMGKASPLGAKLVAAKAGHLPAEFVAPVGEQGPQFPAFVTLQLGPAPLAIEGTVLGLDGRPLEDAQVWIADPTFCGLLESGGPTSLEGLVAGGKRPWNVERTDGDGRFRIDGLMPRDYTVVAMSDGLLRVQARAVRAGTRDLVLRMPAGAVHGIVKGRVVTGKGRPVEGARVNLQLDAFSMAMSTWHAGSDEPVITDAEGRFTLKDVPREGVYLRVDGADILPVEFGRALPRLEDGGKVDDLVIEVSARCHLKIELADAALADHFSVLDGAGAVLPIDLFYGDSRETNTRFGIADGSTPVVAVPESAAALVLYRGEEEVRRVPLDLKAGEVNVLKP